MNEKRVWGEFVNYYESNNVKLKRLIIEPGRSISMQYHTKRSEFWFIESGSGNLYTLINDKEVFLRQLNRHNYYHVDLGQWHRLENVSDSDLEVIEIQYGEQCVEEDIVRK